MSSGEILYSVRTTYPDSMVQGRENVLRLEISRGSANVAPTTPGNFQLIDAAGNVAFTVAAVAGPSDSIEATVDAISATALDTGELYQGRWFPVMPGETDARKFRREVVIAKFRLVSPVAERDLVVGNYPDLRDQLGDFGTDLQPYLDEAWGWFLRKLFKVGRWPDLLISTHDAFDPVRERAWFLVFRFLFRRTRGPDNRFELLMTDHRKAADSEWSSMSARWDDDHDGIADGVNRDAVVGAVHRNSAPRRRLRRDRRW